MFKSMGKRFNTRCNNFSSRTSLHGFNELFTSKHFLGKFFWTLCLTSCVSIMVYQLTLTFHQFINEPYVTVIEKIKAEHMVYENLSLCYQHWIYWVDFDKAIKLNFTKDSVLYGLSYLDSIYSENEFNTTKAGIHFIATMKRHNFKKISEFARAIAKQSPSEDFSEIELYQTSLCYKADIASLIKKLNRKANEDIVFYFNMEQNKFRELRFDYFTLKEYNFYVLKYLYSKNPNANDNIIVDSSNETNPIILSSFLMSRNSIATISPDDLYLLVNLRATASKVLNRKETPCDKTSNSVLDCQETCDYKKYFLPYCFCYAVSYGTAYLGFDEISRLCRNKILFFNSSADENLRSLMSDNKLLFSMDNFKVLNCSTKTNASSICCNNTKFDNDERQKCRSSCLPPCTKWDYEFGSIFKYEDVKYIKANSFSTQIEVKFPLPANILYTNEIENRSVEKLFGNIGGLLGIWLGGSVISFLQLIYICCFAEFKHINRKLIQKHSTYGKRISIRV